MRTSISGHEHIYIQAQSPGVLGERPGPREPLPPDTVIMIWAGMGFAALILLVMGAVHWLGRPKPVPTETVRDRQQWCHYPQPTDKAKPSHAGE